MLRTALDSDVLDAFTSPTDFIFTYSDLVPDVRAFEARYPDKMFAYIDRGMGDPGFKASIADVERGAMTVDQLPDWYDKKARARVAYLTHYTDRSTLDAARAVLAGRQMYQWVATLDGTCNVPGYVPFRGPDLIQIAGSNLTGLHADFSLVLSPTWRPVPAPARLALATNIIEAAARENVAISADLTSALTTLKAMQ